MGGRGGNKALNKIHIDAGKEDENNTPECRWGIRKLRKNANWKCSY